METLNKSVPSPESVKVFESRGFPEGGVALCDLIKERAALLHDAYNQVVTNNREAGRAVATAATYLELSVMSAVKGISRGQPPKKVYCEITGAKVEVDSQ